MILTLGAEVNGFTVDDFNPMRIYVGIANGEPYKLNRISGVDYGYYWISLHSSIRWDNKVFDDEKEALQHPDMCNVSQCYDIEDLIEWLGQFK